MNINSISSFESKNIASNTQKKYAKTMTSPVNNQLVQDTVSFSGKKLSKKGIATIASALALLTGGSYSMINSSSSAATADYTPAESQNPQTAVYEFSENNRVSSTPTPQSPTETQAPNGVDAIDYIELYNDFQLGQFEDIVSLTFDLSKNYTYDTKVPSYRNVILTTNPQEKNEFDGLKSIITKNYPDLDLENPTNLILAAETIIKANPWMQEMVDYNDINFEDGDPTNIDYTLLFETNFIPDGKSRLVFAPNVELTNKTENSNATKYIQPVLYVSKDADEDGKDVLTIKKDDLKYATTSDQVLDIINKQLAQKYEIPTTYSYAGQAIWRAIALDKQNEDMVAGSNEQDIRKTIADYILENKGGTIVLPPTSVGAIVKADQSLDIDNFLEKSRNSWAKIGYMSASDPVADLSDFDDDERDVMAIFDYLYLPDGKTSYSEAYLANPNKYKGLMLAALSQTIDNNNFDVLAEQIIDARVDALKQKYGIKDGDEIPAALQEQIDNMELYPLTVADLYAPLKLDENDNCLINLQPLAYAYQVTDSTPVKKEDKEDTDPEPSDPSTSDPTPGPSTSTPGPGPSTSTSTPGPGPTTSTSTPGPGPTTSTSTPGPGPTTSTSVPGPGPTTSTSVPITSECPDPDDIDNGDDLLDDDQNKPGTSTPQTSNPVTSTPITKPSNTPTPSTSTTLKDDDDEDELNFGVPVPSNVHTTPSTVVSTITDTTPSKTTDNTTSTGTSTPIIIEPVTKPDPGTSTSTTLHDDDDDDDLNFGVPVSINKSTQDAPASATNDIQTQALDEKPVLSSAPAQTQAPTTEAPAAKASEEPKSEPASSPSNGSTTSLVNDDDDDELFFGVPMG